MSAARTAGAVLWDGMECRESSAILQAGVAVEWIAEKFNEHSEMLFDIRNSVFSPEEIAKWPPDDEHDIGNVHWTAWRDAAGDIDRFSYLIGGLWGCVGFESEHPSHRPYVPAGTTFRAMRASLKRLFDGILDQLDQAELPLKKLEAAALAVERGQTENFVGRIVAKSGSVVA